MNKSDKNCIKDRIIQLAKLRSTGPPAQLARKFKISERSVKRIINELRQEGNDIRYDYMSISYVFKEK